MHVTHLSLLDFRNYRAADLDLAPGANTFVGSNGQGKTNLVEAVGYLATLGSHRVSGDQPLIRSGAESAVVRARVRHREREILLELQLNRARPNRAQLNRSAVKPRELARSFSSVLFAPEDLGLVRGDPAVRRRFLDELLVQRSPRLAGVLGDYDRTLRQRNTLLKSARARGMRPEGLTTLDVWDEKLVALGSQIIDERRRLTEALTAPVREAYRAVAGQDQHPELEPVLTALGADPEDEQEETAQAPGEADTPGAFARALAALRAKDLERGVTLVGPHRDDVRFRLNGLPAKGYASHGESWSFALALKLASAALLREESPAGDPVLVLDDVFAELDRSRRERLAEAVADYEQVLITAAVEEDVPERFARTTVRIRAGEIES